MKKKGSHNWKKNKRYYLKRKEMKKLNIEEVSCANCGKKFLRRKFKSGKSRLKYGVKRAGSKTCSRKCNLKCDLKYRKEYREREKVKNAKENKI